MILDFADKETESIWQGNRSRRLRADIQDVARRKLRILNNAQHLGADTALRLSRAFGTSEGFWMGLQADYDLEETRKRIDTALRQVERLAA